MNIVRIGEVARAGLARSGGVAMPLSSFAQSPYFRAADEIIWVGARMPAMHPRMVVTTSTLTCGVALHFDALPSAGWEPRLPRIEEAAVIRVTHGVARLRRTLVGTLEPRGFGALLAGKTPSFPLDLAASRVHVLADAYRRNDARDVFAASVQLLGCGTGLTPSGDDLAGAALFARRFVAPNDASWSEIADRLCREIAGASHEVSAALFADLARGQSFAPLHALAQALADDNEAAGLQAAQELATIGHSSGWDMLSGFFIGLSGIVC